ncbi:MAG: hypothetical protein U0807_16740 [Candidatus Binatia bacterium]
MSRSRALTATLLAAAIALPIAAGADVAHLASCQRKINSEGAKYAQKVIKSTLKCTSATDTCLINCEAGIYGPACGDPPVPPCCDPDNPASNTDFQQCLSQAQAICDAEAAKVDKWELDKQEHITAACAPPFVSTNEICNANTPGLHFATLAAGCQAIIPGWQCNGLADILACVGGPLEKQLVDQVSGLLDPRAADSLGVLPASIQTKFGNLPAARKVKEDLPAPGTVDVWQLTGLKEGDAIAVRVETRNDAATNPAQATLDPAIYFLDSAAPAFTKVADTNFRSQTCNVPNTCGSTCPAFRRTIPRSGTYYLAVTADVSDGCVGGGKYKLVVLTAGGVQPLLVADDLSAVIP